MRYSFDDRLLDTDSYQLLQDDRPIHVEPQTFEVLAYLIGNRERVVAKTELLDEIWGDRFVSESALSSRIRDARRAIGDDGTAQRLIRTAHGRGYRFVGEATELGAGTTASLPAANDGAMEQEIRFCRSSDGVRLAYATVGTGPLLIRAAHWLTHLDYDWNSPVWRHWLEGIARHRTLVRYDERGCGLSDHDLTNCSLDDWVADLEAVVDDLGADRFPLLGVSQGGPVAVTFAARHPERVSKLVLVNTYLAGSRVRAASDEDRQLAQVQLDLIRLGWERDDAAFRQFFTHSIMPDATGELWQAFAELLRRTTSAENAARLMHTWRGLDVTDAAPLVQCPTLVMHSRGDLRVPFDEGRKLAAAIPGSRFVPMASSNHLMRVDEPAWPVFIDELGRFLADA